jgi:hypothetical protein
MAFDFSDRAAKLQAERERQARQEVAERDQKNASARELCHGLNQYIENKSLRHVRVTVESNVVTINKGAARLAITVVGKDKYGSKEVAGSGGFRDERLHNNINRQDLNKTDMMDVVLDWLAEK